MPTTHRLFSSSHIFCSALPPAYTTLMSASLVPPITFMPAELTTCSAIARAAAREHASLDVLEPKTHACILPMAAATHWNALLEECDDVFLADLPLCAFAAQSRPAPVWVVAGSEAAHARPMQRCVLAWCVIFVVSLRRMACTRGSLNSPVCHPLQPW